MDTTGVDILLGTILGGVVIFGGWWWWQRRSIEQTSGWPSTEETIESGALELVTDNRYVRLPVLAFSYHVEGQYYSGRFALMPSTADAAESVIARMTGRKLEVRYNPRRPEVWFIPDKMMEDCKVEQKLGTHVVGLYPRD